jgi:chaperonin GroES
MADIEVTHIGTVTPEESRRAVFDPGEIAIVDVREGDRYASGHISVAVELPVSEIELRAAALLARGGARIVVTDYDGISLAPAAAARLQAIGYQNARVLAGGLRSWKAEGNELITGLNSLSKVLGEFVERHYHTPKISASKLWDLLDSGEDVVVLDTRPLEEFKHIGKDGSHIVSFRPLHERVVLRSLTAEEKTAGGIIIPDTAQEKPTEAEVIAVGPGARNGQGQVVPLEVKPGDKVLFGKWSGTEVKLNNEELLIVKEADILGIISLPVGGGKKKAA